MVLTSKPWPRPDVQGEKYYTCVWCGGVETYTDSFSGSEHKYGRLYPESELIERDGKRYCSDHYHWVFPVKDWAEMTVDISEDGE